MFFKFAVKLIVSDINYRNIIFFILAKIICILLVSEIVPKKILFMFLKK